MSLSTTFSLVTIDFLSLLLFPFTIDLCQAMFITWEFRRNSCYSIECDRAVHTYDCQRTTNNIQLSVFIRGSLCDVCEIREHMRVCMQRAY